jgi:hypothetical protein
VAILGALVTIGPLAVLLGVAVAGVLTVFFVAVILAT